METEIAYTQVLTFLFRDRLAMIKKLIATIVYKYKLTSSQPKEVIWTLRKRLKHKEIRIYTAKLMEETYNRIKQIT